MLAATIGSGSNINVGHELCHKIETSICLEYFVGFKSNPIQTQTLIREVLLSYRSYS